MSNVYSTEPATSGRVVLNTSCGPVEVQLWCKECPIASRAFLQLCVDGFYDSVVFHRIMDGFLIQAGVMRVHRSSGGAKGRSGAPVTRAEQIDVEGVEMDRYLADKCGWDGHELRGIAEAGGVRRSVAGRHVELTARIRFNHRGQVAMALPLDAPKKESNEGGASSQSETAALRPQFFVTLDEAPFLDGKHIIFGTVSGPTIFNAIRIGRTEVDASTHAPLHMDHSPPVIIDVKIDHHPFEDLVRTHEAAIPWLSNLKPATQSEQQKTSSSTRSKKKRKGTKNLNVLSFADEEPDAVGGDGENKTMLSSHDALSTRSTFLLSHVDQNVQKTAVPKSQASFDPQSSRHSATDNARQTADKVTDTPADTTAKPSNQMIDADPPKEATRRQAEKEKEKEGRKEIVEEQPKRKTPSMSAVEARRAKFLRRGDVATSTRSSKQHLARREEKTLAKLKSFRTKVVDDSAHRSFDNTPSATSSRESEKHSRKKTALAPSRLLDDIMEEEDTSEAWMKTRFKCKKHIDHETRTATK